MSMDEVSAILSQQHYALVGRHSAVKLCHWLRKSLLESNQCYKHTFYGITSHRCLQMTPTAMHCNQKCLFCWRYQGFTPTEFTAENCDDPKDILESSIEEQYRLLTGYKGDDRVDEAKWREAITPKHVACSLTGEPTLYPALSMFFEECHKKGMTSFLVTNGTNPKVLETMDTLPSQLYVTLPAPNEDIYKKLCCPLVPNAWESILATLDLLESLGIRTVIRHTLVKGWNMGYEEEYAQLIEKANPWFIEPKGYMYLGYSRERMTIENMPAHAEVMAFAANLANTTGYTIESERSDSRVALLSRGKKRSIA